MSETEKPEEKPKLTPEQIAERRRQKILQRAKKNEQTSSRQQEERLDSKSSVPSAEEAQPLVGNSEKASSDLIDSSGHQESGPQQDAFKRYRRMVAKEKKERVLRVFCSFLGLIAASVQLYMLFVVKKYENQKQEGKISQESFLQIRDKFVDEIDIIFWACFGVVVFSWVLIKYSNSDGGSAKDLSGIKIVPGSTLVSLIEQLNRVLEFKSLIKNALVYTCTVAVFHILTNFLIKFCHWDHYLYQIPQLNSVLEAQERPLQENIL